MRKKIGKLAKEVVLQGLTNSLGALANAVSLAVHDRDPLAIAVLDCVFRTITKEHYSRLYKSAKKLGEMYYNGEIKDDERGFLFEGSLEAMKDFGVIGVEGEEPFFDALKICFDDDFDERGGENK